MAHIFKHPQGETKGIIVFTHKEVEFFNGLKANRLVRPFFPTDYYVEQIERIRQQYFIGVHFGWYQKYHPMYEVFDFLMATESVLDTQGKAVAPMVIPLRSRNFIPDTFQPMPDVHKFWDIICVSNNSHVKNLYHFLRAVRHIYDAGYDYHVLLISRKVDNEDNLPESFYVNLGTDYQALFNADERDRFTIIRPDQTSDFVGLPQPTISYFYNSSRIFALFSEVEGGPKVVSEALLCGLPVVASQKLAGGGLDHLNERNSRLFSTLETAHETLIEAVESYDQFELDMPALRQQIGFEGAMETLRASLTELYQKHGQTFDGGLINTDRLHLRLAAHTRAGIPWAQSVGTTDIFSREQFDIFMTQLEV